MQKRTASNPRMIRVLYALGGQENKGHPFNGLNKLAGNSDQPHSRENMRGTDCFSASFDHFPKRQDDLLRTTFVDVLRFLCPHSSASMRGFFTPPSPSSSRGNSDMGSRFKDRVVDIYAILQRVASRASGAE